MAALDDDGVYVAAEVVHPEFIGYYLHGGPRGFPAEAWKGASSVVVAAKDVAAFIQTSPLFHLQLASGGVQRAKVRVVGSNNNRKHSLFHEVTDVPRKKFRVTEGFANVAFSTSPTPAASALIRDEPDAVLNGRRRACVCGAVDWVEEITPRLLGRSPSRVRLRFLSVKKQHTPSCQGGRLLRAERAALRAVGGAPMATPAIVPSGVIPAANCQADAALPVIRNIPESLRTSVKGVFERSRLDAQGGVGSFTAVSLALNASLRRSEAAGSLNKHKVLAFRCGTTVEEGVSVFIEMENGREIYTKYAQYFGLHLDDKVDAAHQDTANITLWVTVCPKKPCVPLVAAWGAQDCHCARCGEVAAHELRVLYGRYHKIGQYVRDEQSGYASKRTFLAPSLGACM